MGVYLGDLKLKLSAVSVITAAHAGQGSCVAQRGALRVYVVANERQKSQLSCCGLTSSESQRSLRGGA